MENKSDIIDELKEIKFNIKNGKLGQFFKEIPHTKYVLTIIGFLLLYFFYQLGYIFLYGFYFGGDGQFSIFSIMINPVPFNFKSIIGAGAFWLIYASLICIPFILMFRKTNGDEFIFFILLCINGIISLQYMFLGDVSAQLILSITILGTPIFFCYMIFAMVNWGKYLKSTILFTICFLGLLTIGYIISRGEIIKYKSIIILIFYTYILIIIPLLNKLISKSSQNFIITSYDEIIKGKIIEINKKIYKKHKITKKKNIKYNKLTNICIVILFVILVYPVIANVMMLYASFIGDSVLRNYSKNTIKYESSEDGKTFDEKEGIVVAQQGDTYYVSQLPSRKQAIIKSKSIIVD